MPATASENASPYQQHFYSLTSSIRLSVAGAPFVHHVGFALLSLIVVVLATPAGAATIVRREFGVGFAQNSPAAILQEIGPGWALADVATARQLSPQANVTFLSTRGFAVSGVRIALSGNNRLVALPGKVAVYYMMYDDGYDDNGYLWNEYRSTTSLDGAASSSVTYNSSDWAALYTRTACAADTNDGQLPAECDACLGQLQWSSGCSTCATSQQSPSDHCTTCANGGDATTGCTRCRGGTKLDLSTGCQQCTLRHLAAPLCRTCVNGRNFGVWTNCTKCVVSALDPSAGCDQCFTPALDPKSYCTACLNSSKLDPSANCTTCYYDKLLSPATSCATCIRDDIFKLNSRGSCGCRDGNFSVESNCTRCIKSGANPATGCTTCLSDRHYRTSDGWCTCDKWGDNYDVLTNCTTCLTSDLSLESQCRACVVPAKDPQTLCRRCLVSGQDPATNCTTCLNDRYNTSSDCRSCLNPLFDPDYYSRCEKCSVYGLSEDYGCTVCRQSYLTPESRCTLCPNPTQNPRKSCSCYDYDATRESGCTKCSVVRYDTEDFNELYPCRQCVFSGCGRSEPCCQGAVAGLVLGIFAVVGVAIAVIARCVGCCGSRDSTAPVDASSPARAAARAATAAPARPRAPRSPRVSESPVPRPGDTATTVRRDTEDTFYIFMPHCPMDGGRDPWTRHTVAAFPRYPEPAAPAASQCVVCMDRGAHARLLPCGHDAFCEPCVQNLRSEWGYSHRGGVRCPLCRAVVIQCVVYPPAPDEFSIPPL